MKIDMFESFVHSYLKYVEKCEIVQTNWSAPVDYHRVSPSRRSIIKKFWEEMQDRGFLGSADRLETSVNQAEVDVVGVKLSETNKVWLIDCAFHSVQGLDYTKGVEEKVIKKMIRMIAISELFFSNSDSEVIFLCAKDPNDSVVENILKKLKDVKEICKLHNVSVGLDFVREIDVIGKYAHLLHCSPVRNDDADLYLRSIKIYDHLDRRSLTDSVLQHEINIYFSNETSEKFPINNRTRVSSEILGRIYGPEVDVSSLSIPDSCGYKNGILASNKWTDEVLVKFLGWLISHYNEENPTLKIAKIEVWDGSNENYRLTILT